jgi:zinc transporter 9
MAKKGENLASGSSVKVVVTAIGGNTLVTCAKAIGWFFTGSPSMLAETIHSAADTANQILIFVGIKQSEKKASRFFPWGHGHARYVWNLISAMGIFFIGFGFTTYHGVSSLFHPHGESGEGTLLIALSILLFSFIVEGYAFWVAYKEVMIMKGSLPFKEFIKRGDDPTVVGVLLEDGVAVLGVIIAAICILLSKYFHWGIADAIGSIIIGVTMGIMAILLSYLNGKLLIGSAVHEVKEKEYSAFIESMPVVEKVLSITPVILGAGKIHLAVNVELYEQSLLHREKIESDVESIKEGKDIASVLVKRSVQMVRTVGSELRKVEKEIKEKYPEILTVELEVH